MERYFLDTAVLALAVGGEHPSREACRRLISAAARGEAELHASAEAVQELVFHRMRRGSRSDAVEVAREVLALCHIHAVDGAVLDQMLGLVSRTHLGGRDAVHAASAIAAGFGEIVTTDSDFDGVPGLRRRAPEDCESPIG